MDGFGVIDEIRQSPRLSGIPLMMLSSAGQREDAARCRELGVANYLVKPIYQRELQDAILRALGGQDHPSSSRRELTVRAPGGLAGLKVLLAEDNAVNQRLAVRMLEKRGCSVAVAPDGRAALTATAWK
jgi:two-component system sensor histidine kinase/response regulator